MKSFAFFAFALSVAVTGVTAQGTTTATTLLPQQTGYCQQARNACENVPVPNDAECAAGFAACNTCETRYITCRSAPGANQALCFSNLYGCVARAFPATASSTTSTTRTSTTTAATSLVPQQTGYCTQARNQCESVPVPNDAQCAAGFAACNQCQTTYFGCRNATNANQSLCTSNLLNCVARAFPSTSSTINSVTTDRTTIISPPPFTPTTYTPPFTPTTYTPPFTPTTYTPPFTPTTYTPPASTTTSPPYVGAANAVRAGGMVGVGGLVAVLFL